MTYTLNGRLLVVDPIQPPYVATPDTGTLGSGQAYSAFLPDTPTGFPGIIFCHTAGGNQTVINASFVTEIAQRLASYGFPCAAGEDGGTETWGNDASRADIDEIWDYLKDEGASETQVGFYGISMGLVSAMSWVNDGHEAETFAVTSVAGCASMQQVHDDDPILAASMDAAYGGHAGWASALATRDPLTVALTGAFDGIATKQYVGSTDVISTAASATSFAEATNPEGDVWVGPYDHLGTIFMQNQSGISSFYIKNYFPAALERLLVT